MTRGDIVRWKDFPCSDGSTKPKYLVVLNSPKKGQNYLTALTTSKDHANRDRKSGCNHMREYFCIPKGVDWFPADFTWIMLDRPYEFNMSDVLRQFFSAKFEAVSRLTEQRTNEIVNCFKKSLNITDYYKSLL